MRERARHEAPMELAETDTKAPEAAAGQERYVAGDAPPVHAGFAEPGATASMLAFEEDDNVRELKSKVGSLISKKFGGDYQKAFQHYDKNQDGNVDKGELVALLSEAGVGNGMTRGTWASRIIEKLDTNADAAIDWSEFQSVFTASA